MKRTFLRRFSPALALAVAISFSVGIIILTAILWFVATVYKADRVAFDRERETIEKSFRQIGAASARELRIQTVWTEGFTNATSKNTEWMNVYYGPYLNRLLDYDTVLVLADTDEIVYSFSISLSPSQSSGATATISDLISAVRGENSRVTIPVQQTTFQVGEGKTVRHSTASDMRLVAGVPMMVVVSTIVPDTVVTAPVLSRPYLMVAMLSIDQRLLDRIAGDCGVVDLHWSPTTALTNAVPEFTGYDGSRVGALRWTGQQPGHEILSRMRYGLSAAFLAMFGCWFYFSHRAVAHARMIDNSSDALAQANRSLERQAADRTLELEATLNCMAQGLVLLRGDGTIALRNPQVMNLLDAADETSLAATVRELIAELVSSERPDEKRCTHAARRDITLSNGRTIELRSVNLPNDRQVITITDISVSKKRQHDLERAIAEAQAASEAKTRFLSTMSHEMRTPLNGIIGTLELMVATVLTEEQTELVDIAIESSEALLVHINDVLDFSKMEAGKLELDVKPFVLGHVLRSVVNVIKAQSDAAGNELVLNLAQNLPSLIIGDPVRLRQVILNLVSNANKFTSKGRITIDVKKCGGSDLKPKLEISVSDTGIGIPNDRLSDLFREFSMLDSSFTRRSSGTGLGLAISKRLIEAMGGTIGVESVEGEGSRFWCRVEFPTSDQITATYEPATRARLPEQRLNILLVDDNATNRLVGLRLLQAEGHTVTTANNGREALQAASAGTPFDVIFMDISMPEMDGVQATQHIRRLPKPYCAVKVIALTANAIAGDRERFLAAGMDGYLTKPLRKANLVSALAIGSHSVSVDACTGPAATSEPLVDAEALDQLMTEVGAETVRLIVDSYVTEMKQREAALSADPNRGSTDELRRTAHAIAGASASVGARRARTIAVDIENACSANVGDEAFALTEGLLIALSDTYDALSKSVSKQVSRVEPTDAEGSAAIAPS